MTCKPLNSFSYLQKPPPKSLCDKTTSLIHIYFRGSTLHNILWYFIPLALRLFSFSPCSWRIRSRCLGRWKAPLQQPEHKLSMWVRSAQIHIVSYSKTNGRLTQKGIRRIPQGSSPSIRGGLAGAGGVFSSSFQGSLHQTLLLATYGLTIAEGAPLLETFIFERQV